MSLIQSIYNLHTTPHILPLLWMPFLCFFVLFNKRQCSFWACLWYMVDTSLDRSLVWRLVIAEVGRDHLCVFRAQIEGDFSDATLKAKVPYVTCMLHVLWNKFHINFKVWKTEQTLGSFRSFHLLSQGVDRNTWDTIWFTELFLLVSNCHFLLELLSWKALIISQRFLWK